MEQRSRTDNRRAPQSRSSRLKWSLGTSSKQPTWRFRHQKCCGPSRHWGWVGFGLKQDRQQGRTQDNGER